MRARITGGGWITTRVGLADVDGGVGVAVATSATVGAPDGDLDPAGLTDDSPPCRRWSKQPTRAGSRSRPVAAAAARRRRRAAVIGTRRRSSACGKDRATAGHDPGRSAGTMALTSSGSGYPSRRIATVPSAVLVTAPVAGPSTLMAPRSGALGRPIPRRPLQHRGGQRLRRRRLGRQQPRSRQGATVAAGAQLRLLTRRRTGGWSRSGRRPCSTAGRDPVRTVPTFSRASGPRRRREPDRVTRRRRTRRGCCRVRGRPSAAPRGRAGRSGSPW